MTTMMTMVNAHVAAAVIAAALAICSGFCRDYDQEPGLKLGQEFDPGRVGMPVLLLTEVTNGGDIGAGSVAVAALA